MHQVAEAMANQANYANLSSGQISFSDPTKPWTSAALPRLPSTNISITALGSIEDRNISTIYLTNAIEYAIFEPQGVRANLVKPLQITQGGIVRYTEATVGFPSTVITPFSKTVSTFGMAALGAPGIQDVTSSPDTITNALARLDGWITNAFLEQHNIIL